MEIKDIYGSLKDAYDFQLPKNKKKTKKKTTQESLSLNPK